MAAKEEYREGLRRISAGDWDGAIEAFRRALEEDAAYSMAHLGWAQALDRQGRVDEAIVQVRKAIALEPDEPLAHASLSRLYQQKGMISEAEAAMARSRALQGPGPG